MSEIRATTISDAAGTGPATLTGQYAAKAWVNFNGSGTIAARDSENVSSLTDNGAGNYTVNFSNSMANANYASSTDGRYDATVSYTHLASKGPIVYTTTSIQVATGAGNGIANYDFLFVSSAIFGDLA